MQQRGESAGVSALRGADSQGLKAPQPGWFPKLQPVMTLFLASALSKTRNRGGKMPQSSQAKKSVDGLTSPFPPAP
jgi:hypothetical protein